MHLASEHDSAQQREASDLRARVNVLVSKASAPTALKAGLAEAVRERKDIRFCYSSSPLKRHDCKMRVLTSLLVLNLVIPLFVISLYLSLVSSFLFLFFSNHLGSSLRKHRSLSWIVTSGTLVGIRFVSCCCLFFFLPNLRHPGLLLETSVSYLLFILSTMLAFSRRRRSFQCARFISLLYWTVHQCQVHI